MIEIAKAMLEVQKAIKPALKGAENPFFKSKYATLESVWDACRGALQANGISVIQGGAVVDGKPCMKTILLHESGESIESIYLMAPAKDDPQAMGSAITYMRRYSLASMVGVVTTDDDGEAAMERQGPPAGKDTARQTQTAPRGSRTALLETITHLNKPAVVNEFLKMAGLPDINEASNHQLESIINKLGK